LLRQTDPGKFILEDYEYDVDTESEDGPVGQGGSGDSEEEGTGESEGEEEDMEEGDENDSNFQDCSEYDEDSESEDDFKYHLVKKIQFWLDKESFFVNPKYFQDFIAKSHNDFKVKHANTLKSANDEIISCIGEILKEKLLNLWKSKKSDDLIQYLFLKLCIDCMIENIMTYSLSMKYDGNAQKKIIYEFVDGIAESESKRKENQKLRKQKKKEKKKGQLISHNGNFTGDRKKSFSTTADDQDLKRTKFCGNCSNGEEVLGGQKCKCKCGAKKSSKKDSEMDAEELKERKLLKLMGGTWGDGGGKDGDLEISGNKKKKPGKKISGVKAKDKAQAGGQNEFPFAKIFQQYQKLMGGAVRPHP
jgi:hypothetical protein